MKIHPFVDALTSIKFDNCFNPYSDRCEVYDHRDAPQRRQIMLSSIIRKAEEKSVDAIWIGRDLGYLGGRRTGLALTDEVHMIPHLNRWRIGGRIERPTLGSVAAERTAAIIWQMLENIDSRIFLWNVFPLHPHEPESPFTNRQHNSIERRAGEEVLSQLIKLLKPEKIVAIGNDATISSRRLICGIPVVSVRHPSYGGQTQFQRQISELYDCVGRNRSLF